MLKRFSLLIVLASALAVAQTTSVTLQVTDTPDGQSWNNGTYSATLVLQPGAPVQPFQLLPVFGGGPVTPTAVSGNLSGSGGASFTLTSNTAIAPASNTGWRVVVCPLASADCFRTTVVITGASQTVTLNPPSIRINGANSPPATLAYADVEIASPPLGTQYFNVTSLAQRQWNGTIWVVIGGAGTPAWNAIIAPTGNQSLAMGATTTLFTWAAPNATAWSMVDGATNTAPQFVSIANTNGSTAVPLTVTSNTTGVPALEPKAATSTDFALLTPLGGGSWQFNRLISSSANTPTSGTSIGLGPSDAMTYGCASCSTSPITGSATNQNLARGNGAAGPAKLGDYQGTSHYGLQLVEQATAFSNAGFDWLYGSSATHRPLFNPNATGALNVVGITSPGTSGNCVKLAANGIDILDNGSACGSGGGGGNVTTTPGAGINQYITQQLATAFGSNNINNTRWVTPSWNWIQSPSGTISVGSNTITLTPCPLGIDTANFTAALYTVYLAGTGTPEVVPVTGGTCTSGAATGTIIVTAVNTHSAGFTVGSQSTGIQEAINDACRGTNYGVGAGGVCEVNLQPAGLFGTPNYTVQSEIYIQGRAVPSVHFHGHSAEITCAGNRSACIFLGNSNTSGSAGIITDVNIANGASYGGFNVLDVTAASGTITLHTSAAHNFSLTANQGGPDFIYTQWFAGANSGEGIFKVTAIPDSTHVSYQVGSATFANVAGWGSVGLENALIEDNLDGSIINNIHQLFGSGPGVPLFAIVGDNDQHMVINNFTDAPQGTLCNSNICGAAIYQRGDQGNAGIPYIINSEISLGCLGNGVRAIGGNGLVLDNDVIQGYSEYGVFTSNSLVTSSLKDIYEESTGACTNPSAPTGAQKNESGLMSQNFFTRSSGAFPYSGTFPQFVSGGSGGSQINYFIVWVSGGNKSVPLPIGTAQPTNGGVSIPIAWPAQASGAAQTYDLIATVGTAAIPLTGTQTVAVATAQSCTPNSQGWCTFTDTQAARTSYTFAIPSYTPPLWYWPGNIDLFNSTLQMDDAPTGIISTRNNQVSVIAASCQSGNANQGPLISPTLYSCFASDPINGTSIMATFLQQADTGNNTFFNRKGRLNFGSYGNLQGNPPSSTHIVTIVDSNINKTSATAGNRPTNDSTDTYIGIDNGGSGANFVGMTLGAPSDISQYIGNIGDGTSWLAQLTSTLEAFKVPVQVTSGANAGSVVITQGTAPSTTPNSATITGPAAITAYNFVVPAAAANGVISNSNASAIVTQTFSGDTNHSTRQTGQTASIATTTLCPASASGCNIAGTYHIHGYIYSTVNCGTPGPAAVGINLTWTDAATTRSTIAMPLTTDASVTATAGTIALGATTHWGSFDFTLYSTGANPIQYSTTYTGCTSGTGTYELELASYQVQ